MSHHGNPPRILLILALYLILAIGFSVASPIFEAPDELQHVAFVLHLAQHHTLPVLPSDGQDETAPYGQEGGQPPLYYALAAALIAPLHLTDTSPTPNPHANIGNPLQPGNKNIVLHTADEAWPWHGLTLAVHLLRFFSILLGSGTLFFAWKIASGLFPRHQALALAIPAFIAYLPQFLFISAAVTNDNLIIFLSTFILWLVLYWFGPALERTPTWAEALLLGMFLGFAALSKLSGLYLWGLVGLVYLLQMGYHRRLEPSLPAGLLTFMAAVTIAAPWYWRNWVLYGDPTGLNAFLAVVGHRTTPIHPRTEFQGLRISLLGLFGWFNIPLPETIYRLWDGFLAVAGIGFLQGVWRRRFRLRPLRPYTYLILLALWLLILFLALIRWTSLTPGTQGRLLFPGLISLAVLVMLGWREWLPGRDRWLAIPPLALLVLSLYSVGWVIPAAYRYPDLIPPNAVPDTARRAPITFDGRIQLVGAEAEPTTLSPGASFTLTLYWRRVDLIPYNASLFIHVLGRDFADVAQINTYPGWGNAPTSTWPPDQVLVDRYLITLPGGMEVPTKLLVDVGLYDLATQQHYSSSLASGEAPPLGLLTLRALPATPPQYAIPHPTDFQADHLIRLAGYDLPTTPLHPGDTLSLTLFWQALAPIPEDYQVFLHLVDAQGQQVAGYDQTPLQGWWPTSMWEPDQMVRDTLSMPLPPDLPPGTYQVRTGLYRLSDLARLPLTSPTGEVIDHAAILTNITIQP